MDTKLDILAELGDVEMDGMMDEDQLEAIDDLFRRAAREIITLRAQLKMMTEDRDKEAQKADLAARRIVGLEQ